MLFLVGEGAQLVLDRGAVTWIVPLKSGDRSKPVRNVACTSGEV